jgi:HlyD family secretion protein
MATKTQASISVFLGVGATVFAAIAAHSAVTTSQTQYSGVVIAATVTPLNFQSEGYVQTIAVQPGQDIKKGQVLATQNAALAQAGLTAAQTALKDDQATMAADQAAVVADKARVTEYQNPTLAGALLNQDSLQVAKAQQQVQQAQLAQQQTNAVNAQQVTQAQNVLTADQTQSTDDSQTLATQCPTSPPPWYQVASCNALQAQVNRDQLAVTDQQGLLSVVKANATKSSSQTSGNVALSQVALQLAESSQSVQGSPADPAVVAEAQASVARDQAQVERDNAAVAKDQQDIATAQLALSQLELTAPSDGVVLSVGGEVGTLADYSGVRQYGDQSSSSSSSPSAAPSELFSLLPPAPQNSSASSNSDATDPMIMVRDLGSWQVTSKVSEGDLGRFRLGRKATISIHSANLSNIPAAVTQIEQLPIVSNGSVFYNVDFTLSAVLPANVLSGMTADVRLR